MSQIGRGLAILRPATSAFALRSIIHPKFPPEISIARRIHRAALSQELPQAFKSGLGEEGCLPAHRVRPDPHQPTVEHALDRPWDLRLTLLRAISPGAQKQTVGQFWFLAEARHQLEADQVALWRGEWGCRLTGHGGSIPRQGSARRSIAHRGCQCYSHGRRRSANATSNAGVAAVRRNAAMSKTRNS